MAGTITRVHGAALTHQGAVRPGNEDAIAIGRNVYTEPMTAPLAFELRGAGPHLLLVADGMGGHAAGEVASRAVAEHLAARVAEAADPDALPKLIEDANAELYALMQEAPQRAGMGTTVAGLVLAADRAVVVNVGDSRVCRVRDDGLEQLSTDDTPGPKLADGRTARTTSSLITQVLGGGARPEPLDAHLLALPAAPGATYLLCSDGLSDLVDPATIAATIDDDASASVTRLLAAAMARGGRDNISIILARLE